MKKIILLFLVCALLVPVLSGVIHANNSIEKEKILLQVESFLEKSALSRYCNINSELDDYTIASVPVEELSTLAGKAQSYGPFRSSLENVLYDEAAISAGTLDELNQNLELHNKIVSYYAYLNEITKTTYEYFQPSYQLVCETYNDKVAVVDLYETLDFQYSNVDFTSTAMTHYYVSLVKHNEKWLIMAVESDDDLYVTYKESDFDLKEAIEAINVPTSNELEINLELEGSDPSERGSFSSTDKPYIATNAISYAFTYTKRGENGVGGSLGPSPWKNTNFHYGSADCMRFVSQCIWAGFGGSNDLASIAGLKGMDTTGSYKWYGRKFSLSTLGLESSSWKLTDDFKNYVEYVHSHSSQNGLNCELATVAKDNNTLTDATGEIQQADLLGAACLVRGLRDSVKTEFAHAIILTQVQGSTRQTVYFTSYNSCYRNMKLSSVFAATSNDYDQIFIAAPKTFRGAISSGENYLYAALKPAIAKGSNEMVIGYANQPVSQMTMKIYKQNESTPTYTFIDYNCTYSAHSITFNTYGLWTVVISGTGIDSDYSFTIRVVQIGDIGYDTATPSPTP